MKDVDQLCNFLKPTHHLILLLRLLLSFLLISLLFAAPPLYESISYS
jgi:hypothetical protein